MSVTANAWEGVYGYNRPRRRSCLAAMMKCMHLLVVAQELQPLFGFTYQQLSWLVDVQRLHWYGNNITFSKKFSTYSIHVDNFHKEWETGKTLMFALSTRVMRCGWLMYRNWWTWLETHPSDCMKHLFQKSGKYMCTYPYHIIDFPISKYNG